MKHHGFKLGALAVSLMLANGAAQATNGLLMPGYGNRAIGMGGVGIAYGRDALSPAANPANIVNTGMRGDMGVAIFNAERNACTGTATGRLPPDPSDPTLSAQSPYGFDGCSESNSKYYIMPEMGMTMPLTDRLHVGLAFVPYGGGGTSYPYNFFSYDTLSGSTPPPDTTLGVDLMILQAPITVGYKINDDHAVAASLAVAVSRFRAFGLEAFKVFDSSVTAITSDPNHLTGQGFDYGFGAGVNLGWLGEFLDDRLTLGLVYKSRSYMTKFDKYRGLFAEQGDFDLPESYGLGFAIKPIKNLVVAGDVIRVKYSDIAAMANRGPGSYTGGPGNPTTGVLSGIPSNGSTVAGTNKELGNDDGMGFGFKDQTVYKIGVQYGVNRRLQVRAGYNYGKSPIPNDQLTFATLAPAITEKHYSVGFTYRANEELEITGTYMYVPSASQSSPLKQNVVGAVDVNMHQNIFGVTLGWVLDPGPKLMEEYGEAEWDGINFDGWYAGFGFGQSKFRDVSSYIEAEVGPQTATTSANTRSEGWKVYGGYQFNKYLGVEGGYVNLNDMTAKTGALTTNVNSDAWMLAAVGTLPVTDRLSIIGKLGAAYVIANINAKNGAALTQTSGDDSYEPYYGVGVSYALLDNLSLRAEFERLDRKNLDIDLMTAGFVVKF